MPIGHLGEKKNDQMIGKITDPIFQKTRLYQYLKTGTVLF